MINLNTGGGPLVANTTVDPCVSDHVNHYINEALTRRRAAKLAIEDRNYIGMSELGDKCLRRVYYKATKVQLPPLTGERLRVFEMGHAFEAMVLDWMIAAGFDIKSRNRDGQQFEFVTAGGRIKGHIDGAIVGGPPIPMLVYPALWENKALKAKFWNAIVKHGLEKAEPSYYGQFQQYMGYGQINMGLFTTINKDTAEIYHCIIQYNGKVAQRCSDNGVSVIKSIDMGMPPPRISANSDFFICKMCEYRDHCWSSAA